MDVKTRCCGGSAACLAHSPSPVRGEWSTGLTLVSSSSSAACSFDLFCVTFFFFPSVEGVISSIGLDGSGYKQYKSGPGLLVSFTHTENVLVWVTRQKGQDTSLISCVSLVQTAGGDTRCSNYKQVYSVESRAYVTGLVFTLYLIQIWF